MQNKGDPGLRTDKGQIKIGQFTVFINPVPRSIGNQSGSISIKIAMCIAVKGIESPLNPLLCQPN